MVSLNTAEAMTIEKAHAKLNLHLQVLNRQPDGFHSIMSLMAGLSLFDLLQLKNTEPWYEPLCVLENAGGSHAFLLEDIPLEENLVARAVTSYLNMAGLSHRVTISLEKNIPAGGGLGGGSSDAAAVLRLMNNRFNKLGSQELMECAASLGSDVPFCLYPGITLAAGRGEILEPVHGQLQGKVLLVFPGIHVNTGQAYNDLGRGYEPTEKPADTEKRRMAIKSAVASGSMDKLAKLCFNDFEATVFSQYPQVKQALNDIKRFNPVLARMSGSGSTLFGVFDSQEKIQEAYDVLSRQYQSAVIAEFI